MSVEPVEIPAGTKVITFKAYRTWTDAAAEAYRGLRWEVGTKTVVWVTLRPERAFRGSANTDTSAEHWGMMMANNFQYYCVDLRGNDAALLHD